MTAEHNHPSRCCCRFAKGGDLPPFAICPACPEHGDQAECPSCHTPYGRPHTDYCQAVAPAEYPGQPDHCTYPSGGDLRHAGGPAPVPYPHPRSVCSRLWCGLDPNPDAR